MKNGVRFIAPNQKIQFFLTSMIENFEEKIEKSFQVTITYKNSVGKTYEDEYPIDFSQFIGLTQLGEPPLYKIAKNIESIQRDIQHLSTGFYKMKVIRYTKEDVEEERRQQSEQINRRDDRE